jgi:hypothetical protein
MSLNEFLIWLSSAGGNIALVSWILERSSWFGALESDVKEYVLVAFSIVVAVLGYVVLTYVPVETLTMLAPYFTIVYAAISTVILGKTFHKIDKA